MSGLARSLTLVGFLALPATGAAHGLTLWSGGTPYHTIASTPCVRAIAIMVYNPCPVYIAPLAIPCPVTVTPGQAATTYATPTPAPPSAAPATPSAPPGPAVPPKTPVPQVSESHAFFSAYSVAPRSSDKPTSERCSVAFWNLSRQNLTLKIDGQTHQIAPGKNVTLDLARRFVWQVEGREPQAEQIPPTEAALEVVIRR